MSEGFLGKTDATLIHVYGTDRSGSTMLDVMLGNAPDAFSCGEVSAWFRPYRNHHFQIDCLCAQTPCTVWEKFKNVHEEDFHAAVVKELTVKYVIDSSKDICWLIDSQKWASRSGLKTVNLLIWKDPIELAYSYWKRGKKVNSWRKSFVSCYGRLIRTGLSFLSIRYSDLAVDPSHSLEKLCNALGMLYFEGKERFWEKQHHHLFGSEGIRLQIIAGDSRIEIKKVYPEEFVKCRNDLEKQLAQDREVQYIIRVLRNANALLETEKWNPDGNNITSRFLPFWYYRKNLIRLIRRYIPESTEHPAVKNVETIPLDHSG